MVKKYFKNPVFLAFLYCLIFFYSVFFNVPKTNLNSLCKENKIKFFSGQLLSSPAKAGNGEFYKATIRIENVVSEDNQRFNCFGKYDVYLPSIIVEAFYPGKLYSQAYKKGCFLYDTGGKYLFKGRYTSKGFIVEEGLKEYWNKSFHGKINKFRAVCRLQFRRLMYSWKEAGGLLLALLCGSREYTSSDLSDSFRKAGLSHILALSGMHLSMFSGIALFIGEKSKRIKLSFIIRIIFLFLFVWFAGFSPSLLRAFIFSMLLLLASASNVNDLDNILILCFTFLIQVTISPDDISNIGFILSYSALFGIMITGKKIKSIFSKWIPDYFSSSLSASCGAQIFTAPVSIVNFGYLCPIGIVSTVIVSPAVTLFIYCGMLLILFSLIFPSFSAASGIFMNFEYTVIKKLVSVFAQVPQWSF